MLLKDDRAHPTTALAKEDSAAKTQRYLDAERHRADVTKRSSLRHELSNSRYQRLVSAYKRVVRRGRRRQTPVPFSGILGVLG